MSLQVLVVLLTYYLWSVARVSTDTLEGTLHLISATHQDYMYHNVLYLAPDSHELDWIHMKPLSHTQSLQSLATVALCAFLVSVFCLVVFLHLNCLSFHDCLPGPFADFLDYACWITLNVVCSKFDHCLSDHPAS